MLSMIEKIKAASLNKPGLGETPLNLSAMLDTNGTREITGSDNDSSRSGGKIAYKNPYLPLLGIC